MEKPLSSLVLEALGSSEMTALQVSTILRKDLIKVTKCIKNLCYRKRLASQSSKDGQRTYQLAALGAPYGKPSSDTAQAPPLAPLAWAAAHQAVPASEMNSVSGSTPAPYQAATLRLLDEMECLGPAQHPPKPVRPSAPLARADDDDAGVQYGLMADGRLVALEGTALTFFTVEETKQIRKLLTGRVLPAQLSVYGPGRPA